MATIDIRGVSHTYELTPPQEKPLSPVLVFIHGWLLSRKYWQPLIEKLSGEHTCLTYDLRGFGDSQKITSSLNCPRRQVNLNSLEVTAEDDYTLSAYARDLSLSIKELEIKKAWLIGHSLGGSVALWGADYLHTQIQGVICLNSGGGIYLKEDFERFRAAGVQLVKRRPRWLPYIPLMDRVFARAMVAQPINRRWGQQRLLDFINADTEAALGALLNSTTEEEVHMLPQVVSRLEQPVYFIAGSQDKVMEPKYVRHLASFHSAFNSCEDKVIEIPNCGHMSMVEQTERVAMEIRKILQAHTPKQ